jgi:hypothetical protein
MSTWYDGRERLIPRDFYLRVAQGLEPGWSFIEKFGENPDVDGGPADIWSQGGLYNWSTAADIDSISSSNVADAQSITVIGQALDYSEVIQTVVLNGQNRVALTTPLFRVYRAFNASGSDLAGNVYIYKNGAITLGVPDVPADIRAKIATTVHAIAPNQTEMAIYTIPLGKVGFFLGYFNSINNSTAGNHATFVWRSRQPGGVFRVQSRISTLGAGSSIWNHQYPIALEPLPAGTDIVISVDETALSNTACAAGFTVLLKEV